MRKEKIMKIKHQFIMNDKDEKVSVILPIKDYLKLLETIEETEDIKLYDAVKARNENGFL